MRKKTALHTERIRCPFFRCHGGAEIGCEGITDDSAIRLIFRDSKGRIAQERIFCAEEFEKCELYGAIIKKYDE